LGWIFLALMSGEHKGCFGMFVAGRSWENMNFLRNQLKSRVLMSVNGPAVEKEIRLYRHFDEALD